MDSPEIVPAPQATPSTSTHRETLFRGPNGIRAGWRALLFIVLSFAFGLVLVAPFAVIGLMHHGSKSTENFGLTPRDLSITEGTIFLAASLAALVMGRIEKRKYGRYGLPFRSAFSKDFWIGTLVGFAAISLTLLIIFAGHGFHITGIATHGASLVTATAAWCLTFVLVGLAEEFCFRGYLQFTLTTGMGFWPAAFLLSLLFAGAHAGNPGESVGGLLSIIVFALLFCLFLRRRGTLWWAVGFHAGWDWGQTFFYGVADSGIPAYHNFFSSYFSGPRWLTGGTVGPEASVITPVVLVLIGFVFSRVYRDNLYRTPSAESPATIQN